MVQETHGNKRSRSPDEGRAQNHQQVKNKRTKPSNQVNEEANVIIPDEDEEDIPYTHNNSRSTTPLSDLSSENGDEIQIMREATVENNNTPAQELDIVDLDDDDLKEYFVISEDEDNKEQEIENSQRTVQEQLKDTSRQNTSNLKNAHCAVCFESPEHTYILPCGHIYCGDCVFKALSSTKQSNRTGGPCSLCRTFTSYRKATVGIFKKKRKVLV